MVAWWSGKCRWSRSVCVTRPRARAAAGRVAHEDDAHGVDARKLQRQGANMIDGASDVVEGAGPATADVAESAVFDRPGGEAFLHECRSGRCDVLQVVLRAPASAMDEDDQRYRVRSRGKTKLAILHRILAIRDPVIGWRQRRRNELRVLNHVSSRLISFARDRHARDRHAGDQQAPALHSLMSIVVRCRTPDPDRARMRRPTVAPPRSPEHPRAPDIRAWETCPQYRSGWEAG
jgi:hypothetical protein